MIKALTSGSSRSLRSLGRAKPAPQPNVRPQMIHFATSRKSYEHLASSSAWPPAVLWVSPGVLDPSELTELRAQGMTITDFTNPIDPSDLTEMTDALDTIREHHPGQVVWVDGSVAV